VDEELRLQVQARPGGEFELRFDFEGRPQVQHLSLTAVGGHELHFVCEGVQGRAFFARAGDSLWLACEGETHEYVDRTYAAAQTAEAGSDGRLLAPMDGTIIALNAKAGQRGDKGQTLVVLEAMKMEFQVTAGVTGSVAEVNCAVGSQVGSRQQLVSITPDA
jgi:geranyl-CoA carboxylase alpha subunit